MSSNDRLSLTMERLQEEAKALQKAHVEGNDEVRAMVDRDEKVRDGSPSDRQALRVLCKRYGFRQMNYMESPLGLEHNVRAVIEAVRFGDLEGLKKIVHDHPEAVTPSWTDEPPKSITDTSVPLYMVCGGVLCCLALMWQRFWKRKAQSWIWYW